MPELPEVETLVRHLRPLLKGKRIHRVRVFRPRVVRPTSTRILKRTLQGARFVGLERRGKYLLFRLRAAGRSNRFYLMAHLGMTGRMYLLRAAAPLPKHAAVVITLRAHKLVFEDTRYFGRFTLDWSCLRDLGPEPLGSEFTPAYLEQALHRSRQAVKVKLLDQGLVAGIGNIYASEALFRAGISPKKPARRIAKERVERLWQAIRAVLAEAIEFGSTVPLNYSAGKSRDGLFYFGRAPGTPDFYTERLLVYDRAGLACSKCGCAIRRLVQAARSTFYCPRCQKS